LHFFGYAIIIPLKQNCDLEPIIFLVYLL